MAEMTRIENEEALESTIQKAAQAPVWIFKHSLTCPISARAFKEYQDFVVGRPQEDETVYALVEIQRARPISQAVAERTGVRHESPQAILLRASAVAWHASHFSIRRKALEQAAGA